MSRGTQLAPLMRIEEELMTGERPGIGTILGCSKQGTERRESLRGTFSADTSAIKWLKQNFPLSMRKIASTQELSKFPATSNASSLSEEDDKKERRQAIEKPDELDIWSSIKSQKTAGFSSLFNAPYVHPQVKKCPSTLSEKSLLICTESLGSETGSDGYFSWGDEDYSSSLNKNSNGEKEEKAVRDEIVGSNKNLLVVNYNCCVSRKSPTCLFPPPLTSISRRDRPCLQMRSRQSNGCLIANAIPAPSHNYLHAHRQGGRLCLSLVNSPTSKEVNFPSQQEPETESHKEQVVEQEVGEVTVEERKIVLEVEVKQESEVIRVHHPMLVMNKVIAGMHSIHQKNQNPWLEKKIVDGQAEPRWEGTTAFNGCGHHLWKGTPVAHLTQAEPTHKKLIVSKKALVFKSENFLPVMRCKEFGRPVFVWEPFCIATS